MGEFKPYETVTCPKCGAISGDSWVQCEGSCPMPGSPHYDPSMIVLGPCEVILAGRVEGRTSGPVIITRSHQTAE